MKWEDDRLKLFILTSGDTTLALLSRAYRTLDQKQRSQLQLAIADLGNRNLDELRLDIEKKLPGSDLVMIDVHGVRREVVEQLTFMLGKGTVPIVPLGGNSAEILPLLRLGKLTSDLLPDPSDQGAGTSLPQDLKADYDCYLRFAEYWRGGGTSNMLGLLCLAGRAYGG